MNWHVNQTRTKEINIYSLFMPFSEHGSYELYENHISKNEEKFDELLVAYQDFFKIKKDEIISEILKKEETKELIEMLFLNINFITESKSSAIGLNVEDIDDFRSAGEIITNMKLQIFDEIISRYFCKFHSTSEQMTLDIE